MTPFLHGTLTRWARQRIRLCPYHQEHVGWRHRAFQSYQAGVLVALGYFMLWIGRAILG